MAHRLPSILAASLLAAPVPAQDTTVPSYCSAYPQTPTSGQWQSSRVFYSGGRLTYAVDGEGNRIPDYSYAGYRYGQAAIPVVPEVRRLSRVSGDNTARIQQALDQVGARTPDANGIRGALVLGPGTYEIRGTLRVNRSGVVLRGSGDGSSSSSNTILRATGDTPHQRPVVVLGSGNANWTESSARTSITDPVVRVGARSFTVASASGLAVGDAIVVHHPSTAAWIDAVDGGGTVNDAPWTPGQIDVVYYRRITGISGRTLTVDAPIYNHLDRGLAQSYVAEVTSNHVTQAGVESLRIDIVTAGGADENHAWNGVQVVGAHDSWIRRVTALHFGYAGFRLDGAVRFTVADSRALDPVAIRTGSRMYNFSVERRSQLVLFTNCEATNGRHGFISNGVSLASGLVFHRCRATRGGGSEGGHRHWTTGVLYDNIDETDQGQVLLINRGDFGTSHGWGTAHSTIWKYDSELVVQKPPTGQNYGITNAGRFRSGFYFPGPRGHEELRSGGLVPASLYEAQLCERLAGTGGTVKFVVPGSAVTASGHDGNAPANTVDGSLGTRWSASGDGQWIQYDLGASRSVGSLRIAWYKGDTRTATFDVLVSASAAGPWTTALGRHRSSGDTTALEAYDFGPVAGRHVRLVGHGNDQNAWNSITELEVWGTN